MQASKATTKVFKVSVIAYNFLQKWLVFCANNSVMLGKIDNG